MWHLEPCSPIRIRSTRVSKMPPFSALRDGGQTWQELAGLRGHGSGPHWQPGAGGMCLHTIVLDPSNPGRMFIAISSAGAFRTDDGGATWRPINHGLNSQNTSPTRRRRLATAFITWPCIGRARACCSCRNTGT